MANIIKRVWYSRGPSGHKVRKVAHRYTLQLADKQERKVDANWTKEQAQAALAARLLERDAPKPAPAPKTFGQVAQEYLEFKTGEGQAVDPRR
jgi:hypothetical protein